MQAHSSSNNDIICPNHSISLALFNGLRYALYVGVLHFLATYCQLWTVLAYIVAVVGLVTALASPWWTPFHPSELQVIMVAAITLVSLLLNFDFRMSNWLADAVEIIECEQVVCF